MTDILKLKGKLRLKAKERRAWLRSSVQLPDPDEFRAAGFGSFDPAEPWGTIEELLREVLTSRRLRVKLTYSRSPIVIDGLVPDDETGRLWPALVGAFCAAAPLGGAGELSLADDREAARVTVADGEATLASVDLAAQARANTEPTRVPGVIERAKSGRSTCKACQQKITKSSWRFGAQSIARSLPGKPNYSWFHLSCAARVLPHSFGPTLREHDESDTIEDRDSLWSSLSPEARQADRVVVYDKGDRVVVAEATGNVAAGTCGEVVWFGANKYGPGLRVGFKPDGSDDVCWLDASAVQHE